MRKESDLRGYQKQCIKYAIERPACGLFLDCGLGKTVTALTVIEKLMFDYVQVKRVLVIAPKHVVEEEWEEQAKEWEHLQHLRFSKIIGSPFDRIKALIADADIYLISRDNVKWLYEDALKNKEVRDTYGKEFPFDMGVIDELSSFKSNTSKRFRAMKMLRSSMKRVIGLTGTPAPNGMMDLWAQIYLLDMGTRLGKTITSYRFEYFKPGLVINGVTCSYTLRLGADALIRDKIKDICISMKASDYIDLPEQIVNVKMISLPPFLKKQYLKFEQDSVLEYIDLIDKASKTPDTIQAPNATGLSNKLLQFANGAVYTEDEEGKRKVIKIHDLKVQALKSIIEESNGQSVLVAISFQFDTDLLMEGLKEYHPQKFEGAQTAKDWNEGKIRVLFAHPASMGYGLNLQRGGHIIVWYGLTWSLELYEQFNARLHRSGQEQPVIVHYLCAKDTHDEDVIAVIEHKKQRQNSFKESIKARIDKYIKSY